MVYGHMTEQRCPLCAEYYDERTALRIHLEVDHRKSAVVSRLIDVEVESSDATADGSVALDREPRAPST